MIEQKVSENILIALVGKERTHYFPLPRTDYCALHNTFLRRPSLLDNDALAVEIFAPCQDALPDADQIAESISGVVALLVRAGLPVSTQAAAAHAVVAAQRRDGKMALIAVPLEEQMQVALTHAHELAQASIH
jgi:hypothetical protein